MHKIIPTLLFCALSAQTAFAQKANDMHINDGTNRIDVNGDNVYINDGTSSISVDGNGVRIIDGGAKPAPAHTAPAATRAEPATPASRASSYTGSHLQNMSFEGKNLVGASFTSAELKNINFRGADLRNASFTGAQLLGCDLRGALVSGASFTGATFKGSKIGGVDFSGASMTGADMSGADFTVDSATSAVVIEKALTDTSAAKPAQINLAVYFDFDKDTLQPSGYEQIAELGKALASQSLVTAAIRIEGHTDAKGSDEYNVDLSYRRATRVMRVLSEQFGIDTKRLSIKGYGEAQPVASNDTEFGRSQNRRITIVNTSLK